MSLSVTDDDGASVSVTQSFTTMVPDEAPRVINVFAASSSWTESFSNFLGTEFGYAIPLGSGRQLKPLPWANIDQISIEFDSTVVVNQSDLQIRGVEFAEYATIEFVFDSEARVATWTLADAIEADRILLLLSDSVASPSNVALDGEWQNQTEATLDGSQFPSGDGTSGGAFAFRFNVLAGDTNQSGGVSVDDVLGIRSGLGIKSDDTGYSIFSDLNGSSVIAVNDLGTLRSALGRQLPIGEPSTSMNHVAAVAMDRFFSDLDDDECDDDSLPRIINM